jgi:aminoglycoside phosphotransferase family enzyme/predicted kinase
MVQALLRGLPARQGADQGSAGALIETHISFVLLGGELAYKIKKALATTFLDTSTLALRQRACQEELRLNRRLAADLYLDVVPITGSAGDPVLGGTGTVIDWAVKMRAFAQEGLWDRLAARGALMPVHIDELVRLLGPFHDAAAVADPAGRLGSPAQVRAPLLDSLDDLDRLVSAPEGRDALKELRAWEASTFGRLEPRLADRLAQGRVRECHGDLHLGNVTMVDGRTTVFDSIEFNDDFRWIDVMSEIAFMVMDLHAHGLAALAHRLVDGYLQLGGDYEGVRVLPYYLVHRALVRAKVALLRAAQFGAPRARQDGAGAHHEGEAADQREAADHYLALALRFSRPASPVLMLTHGYSGSGKSTLTQALLEAAGAIRIRADVERKRLAGLRPLDHSGSAPGAGLYSEGMTAATYARLRRLALPVLDGGQHVILDATFLRRDQREAARALAAAQRVPCVILDFDADPEVLHGRLRLRAARGGDASEADAQVLAAQIRTAEPLQHDEAGAVFRCRPLPDGADNNPRADWAPLLAWLADPARDSRPSTCLGLKG